MSFLQTVTSSFSHLGQEELCGVSKLKYEPLSLLSGGKELMVRIPR